MANMEEILFALQNISRWAAETRGALGRASYFQSCMVSEMKELSTEFPSHSNLALWLQHTQHRRDQTDESQEVMGAIIDGLDEMIALINTTLGP